MRYIHMFPNIDKKYADNFERELKEGKRREVRDIVLMVAVLLAGTIISNKTGLNESGNIQTNQSLPPISVKKTRPQHKDNQTKVLVEQEISNPNKDRLLNIFEEGISKHDLSNHLDKLGYDGGVNFTILAYIDESNRNFFQSLLENKNKEFQEIIFAVYTDNGFEKITSVEEYVDEEVTIEGVLSN